MLEFPRFVGWQNYSRLFLNDDVFMIALQNTFLFAVITGPISYLACFLFAWIINELSPKIRAIMTLVFYAPSISGNVYFIWLIVFSGDSYGYLNGFLMQIGVILEPIQWLANEKYILTIVIIVQLWLSLGTSFLAFIAGLQTIDKTLGRSRRSGRNQEPLAGAVVHYASIDEAAADVRRGHADYGFLRRCGYFDCLGGLPERQLCGAHGCHASDGLRYDPL